MIRLPDFDRVASAGKKDDAAYSPQKGVMR
jgi:hypothetical protein